MRFSSAICIWLLRAALLCLLTLQLASARERGPRVEVRCPSAPIPVKLAERQILVYELHITNFDSVPLTLRQLQVFADADKTHPLSTISGDALPKVMMEVGAGMETKRSPTIAPGKRAVVFMQVKEPVDKSLPGVLRHRLIFAPEAPGGATSESVIEDFPVTVSQDAIPRLRPPFEGGVWFAGDGPSNDSDHRRTITAIDGRIDIAQRFAIDWVKVGPNGDSHHDGTTRNENWWGYGEPIHAVADGEVTQVLDGVPENTPRVLPKTVTLDNIAGNYVILRIALNR
jgi:murein DD-endopeptidase